MTSAAGRTASAPRVASSLVVVPLAALPVLFLHQRFQPSAVLHLAGLSVTFTLADAVVLCIAGTAALVARREGAGALRFGLPVWIAAGAFLGWIVAASFYPLAFAHGYPWKTHFVTAAKYVEYALLAPAVPILIRDRLRFRWFLELFAAISAVATAVGLLGFCGVRILAAWPGGGRQPSFVGVDDFGALSAAAFVIALAVVAAGARGNRDLRLGWTSGIGGGLGVVLSGSLAAVIGVMLAGAAALLLARRSRHLSPRQALIVCLMVGAVVAGGVLMRGSTLTSFARFLGVGHTTADSGQVESYSHRWLLDYIGLLMFRDHPIVGAGWARGYDEGGYGPYLAKAHARYPTQPALAFPSKVHPWGIQNAYVEALAELGVVGFALFLALIATGLAVALRGLERGPPVLDSPAFVGLLWTLVAVGVWNSLWLIAGNPFDAIVWLGFGLVAAAASVHGGDHQREAPAQQ